MTSYDFWLSPPSSTPLPTTHIFEAIGKKKGRGEEEAGGRRKRSNEKGRQWAGKRMKKGGDNHRKQVRARTPRDRS